MAEFNTDWQGFEIAYTPDEIEKIKRRKFAEEVVVVPFASATDADQAQMPQPVNEYWAGMIA
jgi:hypothetical protein